MGKWIIGIVIIGLLGGGGKYLDQFFGGLAPGSESTVHSITSTAGSTLDRAAESVDPATSSQSNETRSSQNCKSSSQPVLIAIDPISDPEVVEHIRAAISNGAPEVLHLQLHHAEARYRKAIQGQTVEAGESLSLYPFPATTEAEAGIDAATVPKVEDENVSRQIETALKGYCQGQAFKIVFA